MAADPVVDEIAELVGWTGTVDADPAWRAVEAELDVVLPVDFKALMTRFPTGWFAGFLEVYSPLVVPGGTSALLAEVSDMRDLLAEQPHLPFPAEELLPWGGGFDGHSLFWHTNSADPASWPVLFCEASFTTWGSYPGTATGFLRAVLTGEFTHPVFADQLHGDRAVFVPADPNP
ncbi:hypothetical protein [Allokutzneria oryzae]|uniref:SMI1/KNR4 family protein n=1 Tax=Allokutzneria oryzae TaxID=1378989 RepID=A0ABV5ZW24_9PSEU